MFKRCLPSRAISNLCLIKHLRYDLTNKYCNKPKDTEDSKLNSEETPALNDKALETPISHDDSEETCVSKLLNEAATFTEMNNSEWATTPYPTTAGVEDKPKRQVIDPKDTSIILFPGQGTINVGDVKNYTKFPRVKELFEIANEILGYNIYKICLNGPTNLLNQTEYNQPATVLLSLAALEKLQEERPRTFNSCVAVAGYSVGEITALIFSGAIPFEEGIKLVAIRASAMQNASEMVPQGMLSCYCTPSAKPSIICKEAEKWATDIGAPNPVCRIAIFAYTQGKVFGGCNEALEFIEKNSKQFGLRNLRRLPVSGAFHTSLMEPALKPFSKALNVIGIGEPNVPVYSNYCAHLYSSNEKKNKKLLIKQMVTPVKWEQIMQKIYERPESMEFPKSFDMASKGAMKTILKMINAKAADTCYTY